MRPSATVFALLAASLATPALAQEVRTVERSIQHSGQQSINDYKMSCSTGFTPIGFRIVSNRLAGNFSSVPESETATLAFFDWAGQGSQASTIITLICRKN